MNLRNYINVIFFLATMTSCQKPYSPKITAENVNYLVVEGVINSGQDSTIIKLSRTVNIVNTIKANPELNAQVTVESDQGATYSIPEMGNGEYGSPSLSIDNSHKYHLHIRLVSGKEYLSDFEPVKPSPPIDSVGYIRQNNGISLYVNTHDPANSARYYRWSYQETWQFHAKYNSTLMSDGTKIVSRPSDKQIYTCFANQVSTTTLLGSSAKLSQDVIYQNPITRVASTSEKLEAKYSILVKQYALTNEAYNFWQNLKKNTEDLGTIFSSQPSEIPGNIHCVTDPSEPVVGYISVTNVQQKRIFISHDQLPEDWLPIYPYDCKLDSILFCHTRVCQNDVALFLIPPGSDELAITPIDLAATIIGYFGSDKQCADCTIRGTTKQPAFWR